MKTLKVGTSVRVMTMARIAVGRVINVHPERFAVTVRLPNWQADGVHLDVFTRTADVETGHGRAEVCRCVFCPGYRK